MKTKTVTYYCDLAPNWQDFQTHPYMNQDPNYKIPEGWVRVRVTVEIPHHYGKHDHSATGTAEIVPQ